MKTPSALIRSTRFPIEWGDEPDTTPPPGREAARALLDELFLYDSIRPVNRAIAADCYEHSAWFFWFGLRDARFTVFVEASVNEASGLWMVCISRDVGILRSLFGKKGEKTRVSDDCLALFSAAVRRVFEVSEVGWLSNKEAGDKFWNE